MSLLDNLRRRRAETYDAARAITDSAGNRQLTDSESAEFDRLTAEIDSIDERLGQIFGEERRSHQSASTFARLQAQPVTRGIRSTEEAELRQLGVRGGSLDFAFAGDEFRNTLSKLTAGAGGDTVPTSFLGRLVAHMIETSPILGLAQVLTTDSGEDLQVPKTTAHSTATLVSEGSAIAPSDPGFGQVTLGSYKYGHLIQVTNELLTDNGVDLEGYLARQSGRALGNAFGAHATTGDGVDKPRGYVTDATVGVTGGTALPPDADNLIDLFFSVIPPYRASQAAAWTMNDTTLSGVRKLKNTEGDYLVGRLNSDGADFELLGKPIVVDPNMPDVGTGAKSVVFGDFEAYFVRMAGGIRFEASRDFAWDTDMTTYRALLRADGALVDTSGALKSYTSA